MDFKKLFLDLSKLVDEFGIQETDVVNVCLVAAGIRSGTIVYDYFHPKYAIRLQKMQKLLLSLGVNCQITEEKHERGHSIEASIYTTAPKLPKKASVVQTGKFLGYQCPGEENGNYVYGFYFIGKDKRAEWLWTEGCNKASAKTSKFYANKHQEINAFFESSSIPVEIFLFEGKLYGKENMIALLNSKEPISWNTMQSVASWFGDEFPISANIADSLYQSFNKDCRKEITPLIPVWNIIFSYLTTVGPPIFSLFEDDSIYDAVPGYPLYNDFLDHYNMWEQQLYQLAGVKIKRTKF